MFRPCLESLCDRIVPAAHFLYANSSLTADGSLVVEFKEAGLGNKDELVPLTLTGTAEATYQWFNKGGNKPQGNPFSAAFDIDVTEEFQSRNGHVTGTFTIAAPPPPADFLTHPHADNWVAKFTVSYTDIAVVDAENGVSTAPDFDLDQELTTPIVVD
jgi:hypothetical protein